jgi:hypothetical protein
VGTPKERNIFLLAELAFRAQREALREVEESFYHITGLERRKGVALGEDYKTQMGRP